MDVTFDISQSGVRVGEWRREGGVKREAEKEIGRARYAGREKCRTKHERQGSGE